jgi:MFS family permease
MTYPVGLLALPLALLAIFEYATRRPDLWSHVVQATVYEALSSARGTLRATSTFGHPLVAGTALITMGFIVLVLPGRKRIILFSVIVAGALVTVSGSALVGLVAGLIVHSVGNNRQRSQVLAMIVAIVAIGVVLITIIPSLSASFESRVLGSGGIGSEQSESVRLNSLKTLQTSFDQGATVLLTGRGLGGTERYLAKTGGNLGFSTYDNQYVTSIYDSGLLVVLAVIGLIVAGTVRARPGWKAVAPLIVTATTAFFFNALYWPATGLLFWLAVGLATAPRGHRGISSNEPPREFCIERGPTTASTLVADAVPDGA